MSRGAGLCSWRYGALGSGQQVRDGDAVFMVGGDGSVDNSAIIRQILRTATNTWDST